MIVSQEHRRCIENKSPLSHYPRVDFGSIDRSGEQTLNRDQLQLGVKESSLEVFTLLAPQTQPEERRALTHPTQHVL